MNNIISQNRVHTGLFLTVLSIFISVYISQLLFQELSVIVIFLSVFIPSILGLSFLVFPEILKFNRYKYNFLKFKNKNRIFRLKIKEKKIESLLFKNGITPVIIADSNNNVIKSNKAYKKLTSYKEKDIVERKPDFLTCIKNDKVYNDILLSLDNKGQWDGLLYLDTKDHKNIKQRVFIKKIESHDNLNLYNYLYMFYSVDKKYEDFDKHKKMAMYDKLTKIPNRNLFLERIKMCVKEDVRNKTISAIMFLDLDNFKNINDMYGHDFGDIVLETAAKRIQGVLRISDTVARIGGDEFAVILRNIKDRSDAGKIAKSIISTIELPIVVKDHEFHISVSIGICISPQDSSDISDILKYSDLAMYRAKKSGKGIFEYFNNEIKIEFEKSVRIKEDIKNGMDNNEFEIYYLPQVNTNTGELESVEGLIRWIKNSMIINPSEFIPIAEKNGHIYELDTYVLKRVDEHIDFIKSLVGSININISINMSLITINKLVQNNDFLSNISNAKNISIEITESSISNKKIKVINSIAKLNKLGFSITIDDFGSGQSSLSHVIDLPVSNIKIDPVFIQNIEKNTNSKSIIKFIKKLGDSLGATVIAKGVESKRTIEILKSIGVFNVQGFAVSKPLSINSLVDFIDTYKSKK